MVKCPKCNSEEFLFVQRVYEYHTIDSIDNGNIDLLGLDDTVIDSKFTSYLYCFSCERVFNLQLEEIERDF